MDRNPSARGRDRQETQLLLAAAPFIKSACELDLLMFLYRHRRTLLTNEQLAAFVGYDTKRVAKSSDILIEAGLLERTQNTMHASRMYHLTLRGPEREGLKKLLEAAATRAGRQEILSVLLNSPQNGKPAGDSSSTRKIQAIA